MTPFQSLAKRLADKSPNQYSNNTHTPSMKTKPATVPKTFKPETCKSPQLLRLWAFFSKSLKALLKCCVVFASFGGKVLLKCCVS